MSASFFVGPNNDLMRRHSALRDLSQSTRRFASNPALGHAYKSLTMAGVGNHTSDAYRMFGKKTVAIHFQFLSQRVRAISAGKLCRMLPKKLSLTI